MTSPQNPSLYQINTRVWLAALSRRLCRRATLDDVPDADLDRLARLGFDWVWLLSVWQTGLAGQRISRSKPEWRREFEDTLPDLREEDIVGSGFAIAAYQAHADLGGDDALARIRERLKRRGLRLLLDFVPNHTAMDHPWASAHPDYYVTGTEIDLARAPANYVWVKTGAGERLFAHGRDPYFPGWPDVLQLNYGNPQTREAMANELVNIASKCDGVRCDMAMLVLPEVFERTWGIASEPFWPQAIERVKAGVPDFCFMAECYWDMEWTLQQQGFDYTYDKRLYDRLHAGRARPVHEHFLADLNYQRKLVRFLENHDEPRAASTFPPAVHKAAAILSFLAPGLRFFHQGQFEGARKRISPHLGRGPDELVDRDIERFYAELLALLRRPVFRDGQWQLLECLPAWDGNGSWDAFLAFSWRRGEGEWFLVAVNFSAGQGQCYVRMPDGAAGGFCYRLSDLLGDAVYDRAGADLQARGLYLDLKPWQFHVFSVVPMNDAN